MPIEDWFTFRERSSIALDCFQRYSDGNKNTELKFCPIGLDTKSQPSYFIFGDSLAMVLTNVFTLFEPPGMFGALNGHFCSPLLRPANSTPQKIEKGRLNSRLELWLNNKLNL
jgi:hypothetical protein